jgi:hypothetical protein
MHILEWKIMASIDLSLGSTYGWQDGNSVIVLYLSTTWLTTKIMNEPTEV